LMMNFLFYFSALGKDDKKNINRLEPKKVSVVFFSDFFQISS